MSRLSERIENYNKAFELFATVVEEYRKDSENIINHMALLQSFEICIELGWKVLKDYLATKEVQVYLPKDVIKEAFHFEVIPNGQIWIDMLQSRNATSHEYKLEKVQEILIKISSEYYEELSKFREQIKGFINE
ncbi:nucleotidyltransferase substrate binding protein [bacterium]|nr:nucleotidyltransferase substrate binding protein [bacterium]